MFLSITSSDENPCPASSGQNIPPRILPQTRPPDLTFDTIGIYSAFKEKKSIRYYLQMLLSQIYMELAQVCGTKL